MINYFHLGKALTESLIAANISAPIAHENAEFDPKSVDAYIEANLLPTGRESMTKDGYGELVGVYQIDVNVRQNTSVAAARNIVTAITNFYYDQRTFESGGTQVIILNAEMEPAQKGNGWYTVPVSVQFRCRPI